MHDQRRHTKGGLFSIAMGMRKIPTETRIRRDLRRRRLGRPGSPVRKTRPGISLPVPDEDQESREEILLRRRLLESSRTINSQRGSSNSDGLHSRRLDSLQKKARGNDTRATLESGNKDHRIRWTKSRVGTLRGSSSLCGYR